MRVAINGIGVAGPTLAYWLRRFGHDPVLFERTPSLRTGGYLIDFWGLGYEIAARMGVIPALLERCYKMEKLRIVDDVGRDVASMNVEPIRAQVAGRFVSLARTDLASVLFAACDGVPAHFGISIRAIEHLADGVIATLSDGRPERFDLIVGADGLHSHVRTLAFGAQSQFEVPLGCHVAAFRLPHYPQRDELAYVSHTVPKRQAARVALRDGSTLILLICRSDLIDHAGQPEPAKVALRRVFGEMRWELPAILDGMDTVAEVYFDRVSQIHLPRWSNRRVALIGDAAACASLLAGEGTGLAMIEAYVLAGEIHRARGDLGRALPAYEARLRRFVTAKQKSARLLRGFFAPKNRFGLALRDFAVSALSRPFLATRMLARELRDDLALPDYEEDGPEQWP
jgi:2-polyprenyl-6-methoxyphenol hydroxylase-like FAD-dependent oxidoreductase